MTTRENIQRVMDEITDMGLEEELSKLAVKGVLDRVATVVPLEDRYLAAILILANATCALARTTGNLGALEIAAPVFRRGGT